ncbi:MAG: hypothetical protein KDF59_12540 [Nitrosomonas sp.]|nr:hypothetical protein [Nitrosomonas sp.]
MGMRFLLLTSIIALLLTACGEPRRTPDGHLMDRPKVSAYGSDDVTRHDMGDDAESED